MSHCGRDDESSVRTSGLRGVAESRVRRPPFVRQNNFPQLSPTATRKRARRPVVTLSDDMSEATELQPIVFEPCRNSGAIFSLASYARPQQMDFRSGRSPCPWWSRAP